MTAPSPVDLALGAVSLTITSNGTALPIDLQIVVVDIWTGVNRLPRARISISDGSAGARDFPISDSSLLVPGTAITIAMGYAGRTSILFSGVIHSQGLEATVNGTPRIVVEASDKAMVMTLARGNAVFTDMTDSAIWQKLIGEAGLTAKVSTTSLTQTCVQYHATPWDFMILRAQANGMVVTVDDAVVSIAAPDTSSSPVLTLTFGESILDFRGGMDAATQYAADAIQSIAWDPATQALATASGPSAAVDTPGNISSQSLAGVFGVSAYLQQTPGLVSNTELTAWSSAELMMSRLAKIRGTVRFQGSALARPGSMVTLAGLGERFNGNAWVAGVHHRLAEGLWITTLELGLSPDWFASTAARIAAPPAAGLLPPVHNLQSATVKQIDQDPDGEYRILVLLPLLQASDGVWARFGSYYASNSFGVFFYPEIGDEVLVGFLGGDPRFPVVLGSLYSKKNVPPFQPAAENNTKSIMTRSKLHIDFIEDTKTIQLITPGDQKVVINDEAKSIALTDMNGNSITLGSSGIEIKSAGNISMTATGSITITADSSLSASGTASAEFKSTGTVQIKGALVALNP